MKRLFRIAAMLTPLGLFGQLVEEYKPQQSGCCLLSAAQKLTDQLQDWNQLGRYYEDNQRLRKQPPDPGRVVFMGDSITDGWKLNLAFPGKPYVNRGISGQTTPQMLVRVYPDVVHLKPDAMVVLAGTNDLARNTGPVTLQMIQDNILAMTDLAKAHRIKVVFCSVLPVNDYTKHKQTENRPPADIVKINGWLKEHAAANGFVYVDYFSAMVDEKGMLREGLSEDGLHPNAKGYLVMAPLVGDGIKKALGR